MKLEKIYTWLIENNYFTEAELELVTCIIGYNIDSINKCIYARYGYNDFEQLSDEVYGGRK